MLLEDGEGLPAGKSRRRINTGKRWKIPLTKWKTSMQRPSVTCFARHVLLFLFPDRQIDTLTKCRVTIRSWLSGATAAVDRKLRLCVTGCSVGRNPAASEEVRRFQKYLGSRLDIFHYGDRGGRMEWSGSSAVGRDIVVRYFYTSCIREGPSKCNVFPIRVTLQVTVPSHDTSHLDSQCQWFEFFYSFVFMLMFQFLMLCRIGWAEDHLGSGQDPFIEDDLKFFAHITPFLHGFFT